MQTVVLKQKRIIFAESEHSFRLWFITHFCNVTFVKVKTLSLVRLKYTADAARIGRSYCSCVGAKRGENTDIVIFGVKLTQWNLKFPISVIRPPAALEITKRSPTPGHKNAYWRLRVQCQCSIKHESSVFLQMKIKSGTFLRRFRSDLFPGDLQGLWTVSQTLEIGILYTYQDAAKTL